MIPSSENQTSRGFVLRKVKSISGAAACALLSGGARGVGAAQAGLIRTALYFLMILFIPMLLLGALAAALHFDHGVAVAGVLGAKTMLAFPAAPAAPAAPAKKGDKRPANIRQMDADLKALAKELEAGQTEMAAGPITQERGEELEAKAQEMEELQAHIDQYNRISGLTRKNREIESPTLPQDRNGNTKRIRTTAGHLFVASEAFRQFRTASKGGGSVGWSGKVAIKTRMGKLVTLVGEEAVAFQTKAFDAATLSDLGDDAIIEVDRDRELVRFEEPEILTMRDVLNVSPTTSEAIKYVKHVATTRAAGSQDGRGGLKNYLKLAFEPTTISVETIAVLAKVTEQDVDDAPRLVSYINGEMSLDVRVEEERQLLWGTGENGQLDGLFAGGEIDEFDRAAVGDTVIDTIRRMRTDLRKRRVQPNFVMVDPIDWEQIELEKGSDDRYIWGLITDLRGPRIWSLRVVESDAMTNEATGQRRVLVGDGIRGATIYDRHDMRLAVGFVDDDFARNLRTLRAEERLALGLKRPFAFEFAVTHDVES